MPPPTAGGGPLGAGVGEGVGVGVGSAGASSVSVSASFGFLMCSKLSSASSNSSLGEAEEEDEEVWSPVRAESSGRLDGTSNSGQSLPCADSMKLRQIGPAVGPPKPVYSRDCGCPTQTAVEYFGV